MITPLQQKPKNFAQLESKFINPFFWFSANEKDTAEEQYKAWNNYMNGFDANPVINLFHLKPELTDVDESSEPLIKDLILGSDNSNVYANFSVWKGPMQKWMVGPGYIDKNGKLHGFISLTFRLILGL